MSHLRRGSRVLVPVVMFVMIGGTLVFRATDVSARSLLSLITQDPAAASGDWPSSGHDWANTGANPSETTIGVENVSSLGVAWQHEFEPIPGVRVPVVGTAVTANGVAYFADSAGFVHARRVTDGSFVWRTFVSSAPRDIVFNSVFLSAPVLNEDSLFVGDSAATIFRLDRITGAVVWSTNVDSHPDSLVYGDPQLVDGQLIVGVSSFENADPSSDDLTMRGSVVALDVDDGQLIWQAWTTSDQTHPAPKYGAGVGIWSSPAIDAKSGHIYIGSGQHYEPGSDIPTPGSRSDRDFSDSLLSLNLKDGHLRSHQFTQGDVWGASYPDGLDYDVGAPPNLFTIINPEDGGTLDAVGVGDKEGTYYVLNRRSMQVVWSRKVAGGSVVGGFQATAAYADGVIYVAAHEGIDGTPLSQSIPPGESGSYLGTLDGVLLMQRMSRTNIMALEAGTGDVIWETSTPGAITFAPLVLANGVLYHGDLNGAVRAFDAASGTQLFQSQLGGFWDGTGYGFGNFITALSISDGRLLVASTPLIPGAPSGVTAFGLPD